MSHGPRRDASDCALHLTLLPCDAPLLTRAGPGDEAMSGYLQRSSAISLPSKSMAVTANF